MMLLASCQQENLEPVAQESTVTFSVALPGIQTKTIGDGFNVDQLVYEVWKTEGVNERDLKDNAKATRLYQQTAKMATIDGEQKTVISLNLVHDQNYTVLFWAQNSQAVDGAPAYVTDDLTAVTYAKDVKNGSYLSNNENMAAFYGAEFITAKEVEIPSTRRVELRRPFAQLNIGTMNTASEYKVTMNKSRVKISNVPSVFDVAQNIGADSKKGIEPRPAVSDTLAFVFESAALPDNPSKLKVNDIEYDYVAMNYIFADGNVDVQYWIDATLEAENPTEGRNESTDAVVYNHIPQVPLKENYRTNIVGNLLTSTTQYEVVIDASWEDVYAENWDGNVVEVWDENYIQEPKQVNGVYEISLASELAWVSAKVNGMPYVDPETNSVKYKDPETFSGVKFVLVEDIDLVGEDGDELVWIPIGATGEFQGIFDGQGHTISNLVVKSEGTTTAGLFGKVKNGTIQNVTVVNADVQGHASAAVIVAHGVCAKIENCHVEHANVLSTPINKDDANNVGGIVGYLSGETVAYVKGSSVKSATITGYRKVGGIAGAANVSAEVSGNTVANSTITADQTAEYIKNNYDGNAGVFAGFIDANANVSGNTEDENVVVKRYVDSTEELEHAVADAQSGDTIYIGNAEVTMPYFKSKALNFEGINANAVVKQSPAAHNDKYYEGSELNFKALTFVGTSYKGNTQGFQQSVKETYDGCSFLNYYMFAGDETIVNDCTFTNVGQYFWTGAADEITFNRCTFSGTERAVKVCTVGNNGDRIATFNDCEFTAETQVKSAIEIDGSKGSSYKVYINRCIETGFAQSESTEETMFNIEGKENVEVYVDGVLFEFPIKDYVVNGNTYEVYSANGLAKYAYMLNNVDKTLNVKFMSDIQLPPYEIAADDEAQTYYFTDTPITVENGIPSGSNWIPIGEYSTTDRFYGNIDGNGFTVKGLRIKTNGVATGFVGYAETETASVCNLKMDDAIVYNTTDYTGVLVGWAGDGVVIKNCHLTNVHVTGTINVGGIASYSITRGKKGNGQTNLIENCSVDATSTVTGTTYVGGITGHNYGSVIRSCFNAATVSGTSIVGGIAGRSRDYTKEKDAWIIGCGNEGHIVGNSSVGGVVGQIYEDNSHTNAETYTVACYTNAQTADYQNIIIGECLRTTTQYASWGIKTAESQTPAQSGSYSACYAYDSVADITQSDIDAMNAKIDEYNIGRTPEDITYCPYKWTWTPGNLPVLQ